MAWCPAHFPRRHHNDRSNDQESCEFSDYPLSCALYVFLFLIINRVTCRFLRYVKNVLFQCFWFISQRALMRLRRQIGCTYIKCAQLFLPSRSF